MICGLSHIRALSKIHTFHMRPIFETKRLLYYKYALIMCMWGLVKRLQHSSTFSTDPTAYSEKFFITSFTSVNSMWEDTKAAIDQAIKDHVSTKRTPARHTHPWVDTRLRRASRRKNRAFHKAKQTKSPVDWNRYKRLRMQAQKDMRSAHK